MARVARAFWETVMKSLNTKQATIIGVCLFVLVFVALILVASFCDFQISKILTKGSLDEGEYISHGFFAVVGEVFGTSPIYIVAALLMGILFWFCLKVVPKKALGIVGAVVSAVLIVVAWWFFAKDIVGYLFEHAANQASSKISNPADAEATVAAIYEFRHAFGVRLVEVLTALVIGALTVFAFKGISAENLKKLGWFVLAAIVAAAVANLLIMIIKKPIGRMRFRAINSTVGSQLIEDGLVSGYTPWFKANGQPSKEIIALFTAKWPGAKDAFQSFPSGHTCAAATSYALIMLPYAIKFKREKLAKVLCYACPIVITMLVAIARIVAGAHYMSDVTFGGTIGFLCMIISMEIFVCRGSHFFALFPRLAKKNAKSASEGSESVDAPESAEENETPVTETELVEAEQASDMNVAQKEVANNIENF